MSLEDNLIFARQGVAHVRAWRLRANNVSVPSSLDPQLRMCVNDIRFTRHHGKVLGQDHSWGVPRLNLGDDVTKAEADAIRAAGCGNCMEQAAVAFEFLDRVHPRARPIHYCSSLTLDHVFVLVGPATTRHRDGVSGQPSFRLGGGTVGTDGIAGIDETAVCDPWIEERYPGTGVYPARELPIGMLRVASVLREVLSANGGTSEQIGVATSGMAPGSAFEFTVRYSK